MWKITFFSLVAVLSTVQGFHLNGFSASSWDQMMAELMHYDTGTCGDACYVQIDGEVHLLEKNDDPLVHPRDPCLQFTCDSSGPRTHHIQCPEEVICPDGAPPVKYHGQCCQKCLGGEPEPQPCLFGKWSLWTKCSRTCGGGLQSRSRTYKIPENSDFVNCVGKLREVRRCLEDVCCPENCLWEWGDYSPCSHTCGEEGTKMRSPIVTRPAECGGGCDLPLAQTERCNTHIKCPVDCVFTWGKFTECSRSCGGGTKTRSPIITQHPRHGGRACPSNQTMVCNDFDCPLDCKYTWGEFTECSKSCGGGTKTRSPIITQHPRHGGRACPSKQTMVCNDFNCPLDCVYTWGEFTDCSKSCGGGTKTRSPIITQHPRHGGRACPSKQTMVCNDFNCPLDCVYTWGKFTECSKSCGGGKKTRSPIITQHPRHGGRACPSKQTMVCNDLDCPLCEPVAVYHKDKDCIEDGKGNCVAVANANQDDEDGDGIRDACDNCIYDYNPGQENHDGDSTGDKCDPDYDNDGHSDNNDWCGKIYSVENRDRDNDRIGDCCDDCTLIFGVCHTPDELFPTDSDGDGLPDECDNCPYHPNPEQFRPDGKLPCDEENSFPHDGETPAASSDYDNDKKGLTAQIMELLLEMYSNSN